MFRFGEDNKYVWCDQNLEIIVACWILIGLLGLIRERNWHGAGGMENAKTKKTPQQSIPTFAETVDLLMKVGQFGAQPVQWRHTKLITFLYWL